MRLVTSVATHDTRQWWYEVVKVPRESVFKTKTDHNRIACRCATNICSAEFHIHMPIWSERCLKTFSVQGISVIAAYLLGFSRCRSICCRQCSNAQFGWASFQLRQMYWSEIKQREYYYSPFQRAKLIQRGTASSFELLSHGKDASVTRHRRRIHACTDRPIGTALKLAGSLEKINNIVTKNAHDRERNTDRMEGSGYLPYNTERMRELETHLLWKR